MTIVCAGVSHGTASLSVREPLARSCGDVGAVRDEIGAAEAVLLSTCNRVEIYAAGAPPAAVLSGLSRGRALPEGAAYVREDVEAVHHLFRVASSLDSLVLGENQILGQVLVAENAAVEAKTAGPLLRRLFESARRCGRDVRTLTRIGEGAASVASIALELALKVYGNLAGRRIMLLGAGDMGHAAVENLRGRGAVVSVVCRSRRDRAEALAEEAGGEVVELEAIPGALARVDIVLSSTSFPGYVVTRPMVEAAMRGRHTPLLLLDIAVPRDIDPAIHGMHGVYLFDMDGLETMALSRREARREEVSKAEVLVRTHVDSYLAWLEARNASHVIRALEQRFEDVRAGVWKEMTPLLESLGPRAKSRCEYLTRLMVQRLLHAPLTALGRGDAVFPPEDRAAALETLFDLAKKTRDDEGESSPADGVKPKP